MMFVFRRYPPSLRLLVLGLAAVTVSGLSSCDSSASNSTTSSSSPAAPSSRNLTGSTGSSSTSLGPSSPSQLSVPSSGAQPPSNPLSLPGGGASASQEKVGDLPAGSLPSTGGANLPQTGTQQSSSTTTQEIAKAKAALGKTTQSSSSPIFSPEAGGAETPEGGSGTSSPTLSGGSENNPLSKSSGLTEEAKALSQPVSRKAPPAASSATASTSLPSIRSNSLPSLFDSSKSAAPNGNRPSNSNSGNSSAGQSSSSGLQTSGYVYNPATGGYGPSN
jgi:hypothetical protein